MHKIDLKGKRILVTGAAGFIGADLVLRLLQDGQAARVVGIDNLNDYYDPSIKHWRLARIDAACCAEIPKDAIPASDADTRHPSSRGHQPSWRFITGDISDRELVGTIFSEEKPDIVVNLAAQAGVRYSITNPDSYIRSNLIGFYNILEACRHSYDAAASCETPYEGVQHLVYASSSSVYGANQKIPFSTEDKVDDPVSLYAATKKSDELMAHAYSKLYNIPSTGLRFFTVYGPAGRPDMAYYGFTDKLRRGKTIQIYNYGNCCRDFTYIDDITEGIVRVMQGAPERHNGADGLPLAPYSVYNIGEGRPVSLLDFISILQEELIRAGVLPKDYDFEAHKKLVPMQPGDVPVTYADTSALERDYGYRPGVDLRSGLRSFAEWYRDFYADSL
jgi:UDP-glucuronate 4-epimerase